MDEAPFDELIKSSKKLFRATIVSYLILFVLSGFVWIDASVKRDKIAQVTENTNAALCIFRADLERRVADGIQFLKDHPDGIPGIPAQSIQQSLDNQQRTIVSLAILDCPES